MKIIVTNEIDTIDLNKNIDPKIVIKATNAELSTLRQAADICDKLRIAFDKLEIFDKRVAELAYENLLEIADLIEDHERGDKHEEIS